MLFRSINFEPVAPHIHLKMSFFLYVDFCSPENIIYLCYPIQPLFHKKMPILVPVFFMLSIGIAIVYNLGSNYFMGEVSYITKALAAVLQLGVTLDYSIFLWHSYKEMKEEYGDDHKEAMAHAIASTITSVVGSSITTVAGFIALCFMSFTLGMDLGVVMAKGVVFGVICCVTVLPVGNIFDEYDDEEVLISRQPDGSYIIDGQTLLEDIEDAFDMHFDCEDIDTINGYLIYKMGKIPQDNEQFECTCDGYSFRVLEVHDRMVTKVGARREEERQQPVT